jgi:two-component system heavy metal sensor histidine kinase CusS
MCYEILVQMQTLLAGEGIELTLDIEDDVPTIMLLDREWMQRALNNYLENTSKYAADGNVAFKVYLYEDNVCFEVIDNGPGIPRQALPRLFDRFYRVDGRSQADGSGLGLAIVKSVAEAHGGQAYVESEEGEGSTFGIMLPLNHTPSDSETNTDVAGNPSAKEAM